MARARDPFRRQPPGAPCLCALCVPVARQQRASDPRGRMGHCVGLARARVNQPVAGHNRAAELPLVVARARYVIST